mmetsp:Transcript_81288/g.143395  ORF Transcript_81288/g.143395 Transcript_81288/m.143395 type:complete len:227 (+) Transcript_81288:60-740(+)
MDLSCLPEVDLGYANLKASSPRSEASTRDSSRPPSRHSSVGRSSSHSSCRSAVEDDCVGPRERLRQRRLSRPSTSSGVELSLPELPNDLESQVVRVFKELSAGEAGLSMRGWQRVVGIIQKNPVLGGLVRPSDVDRLFYAATHRDGKARRSITCRQFRVLLEALSEAMGVSPCLVFLAVGSHAGHLEQAAQELPEEAPAKLKRSSSLPGVVKKKLMGQIPARRLSI